MTKYTTIAVKPDDHQEIKHVAWYERQAISDLVPQAVRVFAKMTPTERAEILARQQSHCTPA